MGSILGSFLADRFMIDQKYLYYQAYKGILDLGKDLWRTEFICKECEEKQITTELNNFNMGIQFTYKTEIEWKVSYFDVQNVLITT